MTTTEKVRLVDQHREERGLNRCLRAIDLPKSTYYYRRKRSTEPSEEEQKLMNHVREIIQEHPEYGYRRILPELEERTARTIDVPFPSQPVSPRLPDATRLQLCACGPTGWQSRG